MLEYEEFMLKPASILAVWKSKNNTHPESVWEKLNRKTQYIWF